MTMQPTATGALLGTMLTLIATAASAAGPVPAEAAQKLYDRITPSLVVVQYTWESELGRRELAGAGVVVSEDGVVMAALGVFDLRIPDEQMKEFKVIVPRQDAENEELEATFINRDERSNTAFVRVKQARKWQAVRFAEQPLKVGQDVLSVGLLPKDAGYKSYFAEGRVSAMLRGEVPHILVTGGLCGVGSPVFSADGQALGFVNTQRDQPVFLNDPRNPMGAISNPPPFFVPARDFLLSIQDPPPAGRPQDLPWLGLPQLTGLEKDVAEFFGLKNQPAVEIGDIIPNSPAEKAGLKRGMIIVKLNGQPLERGDQPEELPAIFRRQVLRMKPGQEVKLSVMAERGQGLKEIAATLEVQPKRANSAVRYYAEDLGFSAREIVFWDTYVRKLPAEQKGVVVALIKPQGAAQNAKLMNNDLVTEMNNNPVTDVEQFKKLYQEFRKAKPREAVVLVVIRESNTQVIRIEPPQ